jgi:hypothetical protein
MEIAIGILIVLMVMLIIWGIKLHLKIKNQLEQLKDFDIWKEWKNKQQ